MLLKDQNMQDSINMFDNKYCMIIHQFTICKVKYIINFHFLLTCVYMLLVFLMAKQDHMKQVIMFHNLQEHHLDIVEFKKLNQTFYQKQNIHRLHIYFILKRQLTSLLKITNQVKSEIQLQTMQHQLAKQNFQCQTLYKQPYFQLKFLLLDYYHCSTLYYIAQTSLMSLKLLQLYVYYTMILHCLHKMDSNSINLTIHSLIYFKDQGNFRHNQSNY